MIELCTSNIPPAGASVAASDECEVESDAISDDETLVTTAADPADGFLWFVSVTRHGIGLFDKM
jgi:hypothetical protein